VSVFLFLFLWVSLGGISYVTCLYAAKKAYASSRPGGEKPGSFAFAAAGVTFGMQKTTVSQILGGWETLGPMKMEERSGGSLVPWKGYVIKFSKIYDPLWYNPIKRHKEALVREELCVYFDEDNSAIKACRQIKIGSSVDVTMLDLASKTCVPLF